MQITLLTLGTRGDVQPYMALGIGLQQAGHLVTLGTSSDFREIVTRHGLNFAPFSISIRQMLQDPDTRKAFVSKRAALRVARKAGPLMPQMLEDAWAAASNADLLIYHPKILNGLDIAEKLRIPSFIGFYLPITPTRAFPAPFLPVPAWGGAFNRVSHRLFLRLLTAPYRRLTTRWRRSHGLPPRGFWAEVQQRYGPRVPKLYAYSRHVVPVPPDWDGSAQVTGQWFLRDQSSWNPPADLLQFLASGPPPVLVGFGSIAGADPHRTTAIVLDALRQSGQRGLLVGGWGGLAAPAAGAVGERVHFLESIPYEWLLPQVSAVVHHGGAGSTGEGLRAGKPAVVCPFFGDQPFWGRRIYELGVGPPPVPQKRLAPEPLAEAIRAVTGNEAMRRRSEALGQQIRAEDGVQTAVAIINATFAEGGRRT